MPNDHHRTRPAVCVTSGVFRWLCDIHAVKAEHGEGCSAGGCMLTNDGAEVTMGGASDLTSTSQHSVRVRLLYGTQILLITL